MDTIDTTIDELLRSGHSNPVPTELRVLLATLSNADRLPAKRCVAKWAKAAESQSERFRAAANEVQAADSEAATRLRIQQTATQERAVSLRSLASELSSPSLDESLRGWGKATWGSLGVLERSSLERAISTIAQSDYAAKPVDELTGKDGRAIVALFEETDRASAAKIVGQAGKWGLARRCSNSEVGPATEAGTTFAEHATGAEHIVAPPEMRSDAARFNEIPPTLPNADVERFVHDTNSTATSRSERGPEPAAGTHYLAFGPYAGGQLWKWSCRGVGGAMFFVVLAILGGAWPGAIAVFLLATIPGLVVTHRVGLAIIPPTKLTSVPGEYGAGGLWTLSRIWQDRIGDVVLTCLWNIIRRFTSYRV